MPGECGSTLLKCDNCGTLGCSTPQCENEHFDGSNQCHVCGNGHGQPV